MIQGKFLYKSKNCNKDLQEDRKFEQCFVWKADDLPIYIMDNHRAALWCWLQEINLSDSKKLKLLHIDNHHDMSPKGLHCECVKNINIKNLSLDKYLNKKHDHKIKHLYHEEDERIFSYENFLRIFSESSKLWINKEDIFLTNNHWNIKPLINPKMMHLIDQYKINSKNYDCIQMAKQLYLVELKTLLKKSNHNKWIVDLDLDYFYNEETKEINFELSKLIIKQLLNWQKSGRILVITVAWSPEFLINRPNFEKEFLMPNWSEAKKINSEFCKFFGIYAKDFENL